MTNSHQKDRKKIHQPIGLTLEDRPEPLGQLERLKNGLSACVEGLISSRELSDLCKEIEDKLAAALKSERKLSSTKFWKTVDVSLKNAHDSTACLRDISGQDGILDILEDAVQLLNEFEKVMRQVESRKLEPHAADCLEIARTLCKYLVDLGIVITPATAKFKKRAGDILADMGKTIEQIRNWLRITDEKARDKIDQPVDSWAKMREESTEEKRTCRQPLVGVHRGDRSRADAGKYRR